MKVCIVGASGKLGQYIVRHALNRGYDVTGVCRERGVGKLDRVVSQNTNEPNSVISERVFVTRKHWSSVKCRRRAPNCSRSTRFSSFGYSITSC